uniref:Uncharacterized protein n=1 Tax=Plectus sambesii TaxID=2011161 RepID=A0A914VXM3_9BILA
MNEITRRRRRRRRSPDADDDAKRVVVFDGTGLRAPTRSSLRPQADPSSSTDRIGRCAKSDGDVHDNQSRTLSPRSLLTQGQQSPPPVSRWVVHSYSFIHSLPINARSIIRR